MVGYSQELPSLAAVATALWAVLVCGRIAFKHGANVVAKISIRFFNGDKSTIHSRAGN